MAEYCKAIQEFEKNKQTNKQNKNQLVASKLHVHHSVVMQFQSELMNNTYIFIKLMDPSFLVCHFCTFEWKVIFKPFLRHFCFCGIIPSPFNYVASMC